MGKERLKDIIREGIRKKFNMTESEFEQYLRMPICEQRKYVEQKTGIKTKITGYTPIADSAYTFD